MHLVPLISNIVEISLNIVKNENLNIKNGEKKWFSPLSFLLPVSVTQSDFSFYCVVHLNLDLHSKQQGIKN